MTVSTDRGTEAWPELPLESWRDTCETLHLWTQIVGKIRLAQTPAINHSWHVTLYVTPCGLTTSAIPHGSRSFEIEFDFLNAALAIRESTGRTASVPLEAQSVATFHERLMRELDRLDLHVDIHPRPNEIPGDALRFDEDEVHATYDPEQARRYWRVLVQADRVFRRFRAGFVGKCSPVHYFWGAPDLAVTRFSGRLAPEHPGGVPNLPDHVTREAYSHEVASAGFWPGGGPVPHAAFYAYAYPEPPGYAEAGVEPREAFYSKDLHEFLLPYDAVRQSSSPDDTLLAFLQSTYEAGANLGKWDRAALEKGP